MIPYKLSIFHIDYAKSKTKELRELHNCSWSIYFNNRIPRIPFGYCAFFDNKRVSSSMRKFLLEMGYEEDVVVNRGFVVEIDKKLGFSRGTVVLSKGRKKYITKLDGGAFDRSFSDIFKESNGSIKNWKFSETVRVEVFHYGNHLSVGLALEKKNSEKTRLFYLSKLSYKKPWKKELIPGHLHQTRSGEYLICLGHVSDVVTKSERGGSDAAISIFTHYSNFYQFFNRSSLYYGSAHVFKKSTEDCAVCIEIPSELALFTDSNDFTRYSKSDGVIYLLNNLLLNNFSSLLIYPPSRVPNSIPLCKVCKPAKDFRSIFLDATSIHNLKGDFIDILKIILNPKTVSYTPEIKKAYFNEYEKVCKSAVGLIVSNNSSTPNVAKVDSVLNYLSGKSTVVGINVLGEWESGLFVDPIPNEDTKKLIISYLKDCLDKFKKTK